MWVPGRSPNSLSLTRAWHGLPASKLNGKRFLENGPWKAILGKRLSFVFFEFWMPDENGEMTKRLQKEAFRFQEASFCFDSCAMKDYEMLFVFSCESLRRLWFEFRKSIFESRISSNNRPRWSLSIIQSFRLWHHSKFVDFLEKKTPCCWVLTERCAYCNGPTSNCSLRCAQIIVSEHDRRPVTSGKLHQIAGDTL